MFRYCLQVLHSQRLNEIPVKCWVVIENSGEVCCAHCNCMAGLGEACTHIGAILFYLEAVCRFEEAKTCTQGLCTWNVPCLKKIEYLPTKEIDFTSARGKKRKLDDALEGTVSEESIVTIKEGSRPTSDEFALFYKNISHQGTKPAILSLIPNYSDNYVPKSTQPHFPQPLTALRSAEYIALNYHELLQVCENLSIDITKESCDLIERETKSQNTSKLWYKYRAGRVTASRMRAVCHTNLANPSQSLIKSICYPEAFQFTSKATEWGCSHERQARVMYEKVSKSKHQKFSVEENGLFINPQWPYIGASPDGIVCCLCCGRGALEIKCPYCHRGESIDFAASHDKKFCLKETDGKLQLDSDHMYYYQIQTQLFICDVEYCDFCVCTFADTAGESAIHIERIHKNSQFWINCVETAKSFFRTCLLPELMGSWYTRPVAVDSSNGQSAQATEHSQTDVTDTAVHQQSNSQLDYSPLHDLTNENQPLPTYCYCRGPEFGKMLACDNKDCVIEWFHIECLKLKVNMIPKGKWYCPDCRKNPKFCRGNKGKSKAKYT